MPNADAPNAKDRWERAAHHPGFKDLMAAKARFIIPATLFFVVYYFALPILVGYAPGFMSTRVWGPVNLAYLFALSQFFVAWIIAALYIRAANRFDQAAKRVVERIEQPPAPAAKEDR
jgi:uncharacterized membrane protein (DUF485 family)